MRTYEDDIQEYIEEFYSVPAAILPNQRSGTVSLFISHFFFSICECTCDAQCRSLWEAQSSCRSNAHICIPRRDEVTGIEPWRLLHEARKGLHNTKNVCDVINRLLQLISCYRFPSSFIATDFSDGAFFRIELGVPDSASSERLIATDHGACWHEA